MNKLSSIKIVSIDLFRTLIDIDPPSETLWHKFLRTTFSNDISGEYGGKADEILARRWDVVGVDGKHFKSVREILEDTAAELFNDVGIDYDPKVAAGSLIGVHNVSQKLFEDVEPFLNTIGDKYQVCLSTDADLEMVENVHKIYPFDNIFVSEELEAYKLNPGFFSHVIKHYNVPPENILHIGDSKSDIIAPKQLGVQTCWLNRNNHKWRHPIKPDFEVRSLLEILDILD